MIRHACALTLAVGFLAAGVSGLAQGGLLVAAVGFALGGLPSSLGATAGAVALSVVAKPADAHLDAAQGASEQAKGVLNG